MPDHGGQRLEVHAMLQWHGCEGMSEIMETYLFTAGALEYLSEPLYDRLFFTDFPLSVAIFEVFTRRQLF